MQAFQGHRQCMVGEIVQNTASISLHSSALLGISTEKVFPNALRQHSDAVKILIMVRDLPQGYTCTELHELATLLQIRNVFAVSLFVDGTLRSLHLCIVFHVSCNGFLPCL